MAKKQDQRPLTARELAFIRTVVAKYASLTTTRGGKRESRPIEYASEEKSQFRDLDRLQAIALGRDLNRNNPKAITIIDQREVLTLGTVKAQFNTSSPEWNAKANAYFNKTFARDCYFNEPMHLEEYAQMVEGSRMREGDVLVVFDDFLLETGKLLAFEADQLCEVNASDWEDETKNPTYRKKERTADGVETNEPFFQDSGVICDEFGRVAAYCVSRFSALSATEKQVRGDAPRGVVRRPIQDCLIVPIASCRLVKHRFRFGQRRGVPSLLPVAATLSDIEEMVQSELFTARFRSKILAYIKRNSATVSAEESAGLAALLERMSAEESAGTSSADAASAAAADGAAAAEDLPHYSKVEEATGGFTEYLAPGDELQIPQIDRPNLDTNSFYDHLADQAGASQGLARGYSRMAVASSYTAHRGETCMTDRHIRRQQKLHEHNWLDWLAGKVVARAVEKKELPPPPEHYAEEISWVMPRPDQIDPEKEARAKAQQLKNGELDFSRMLGSDWRERFAEYAEEIKAARDLGLPLGIFETAAGAELTSVPEPGKSDENDENDEKGGQRE